LDIEIADNLSGHGIGLGDVKEVNREGLQFGFNLRQLRERRRHATDVLRLHELGLIQLLALLNRVSEAETSIRREQGKNQQANPKWIPPG
jgi:hypothetical protein